MEQLHFQVVYFLYGKTNVLCESADTDKYSNIVNQISFITTSISLGLPAYQAFQHRA